MTARAGDGTLVGFVNVARDGGDHAFLIDTRTRPDRQHQGVGTELVRIAALDAEAAGCEWLHVDFTADLAPFQLDACRFRPTAAGLIHLAGRAVGPWSATRCVRCTGGSAECHTDGSYCRTHRSLDRVLAVHSARSDLQHRGTTMTKIEYPPLAGPNDPAWWTPLKGAIQSIGGVHRSYRLLPSDFMYMYRAVRRERPDISAYQHRWTRHYLHLDAEGRPYRFVAAAHPAQGPGRYLRYRNLAAALDRLALWKVPSSRLEEAAHHDACGGMALTDAEEGSDGRLHLV